MRIQKPTTLKGWAKWAATTLLVIALARIAYPILDLNIQTWAQANGVDRMWAWRWHVVDPFAAGLGWWVAAGAMLVGLIVGMAVDGWSMRVAVRLAPKTPSPLVALRDFSTRASEAARPAAAPPARGTLPAYRTAVLQILKLRPEMESNSDRVVMRSTCTIDLKNVTQQDLVGCTMVLVSIASGGRVRAVGEALQPGEFTAPRSQTKPLILVRRDRTDVISNPPHMIRTVDRDIALEDGVTYVLKFELRSQYSYPTLATVRIDVPENPNTAVVPSIVSQDVDRT